LVGPPLFEALDDKFGASALTIQGVNDYSASVQGYLAGGDPNGSAEMYVTKHVTYLKSLNMKVADARYTGHAKSSPQSPNALIQN
jgi:hypothetical protein